MRYWDMRPHKKQRCTSTVYNSRALYHNDSTFCVHRSKKNIYRYIISFEGCVHLQGGQNTWESR